MLNQYEIVLCASKQMHSDLLWQAKKRVNEWSGHRRAGTIELFRAAGAGDGDRTHDIKLGKLAFYH